MTLTRILFGVLLALGFARSAAAVEISHDAVWQERIEADCKLQAKKYYSVIHFKKRRMFVKHCIDRANR